MRRLIPIAALLVFAASAPAQAAPGDLTTLFGDPIGNYNPLYAPRSVSEEATGSILVADTYNHRVVRVTRAGTATTVAGILDQQGFSGDGGPATQAKLNYPYGVAALPGGGFLVVDSDNHRIRHVSTRGIITTAAGGGESDFGSDARTVRLGWPLSAVPAPGGGFLVVEGSGNRIRRVWPDGSITKVAGNRTRPGDEQGIPPEIVLFSSPTDASFTRDGGILVADSLNSRVVLITRDGKVRIVAGIDHQSVGVTGDGGPATAAHVGRARAVAATSDGGFLVAQELDHRIRRVSPDGVITTLAGGREGSFLNYPHDVVLLAKGGAVVADTGSSRVKLVETDLRPVTVPGLAIEGWSRPRVRSLLRGTWSVSLRVAAAGTLSAQIAARGRALARGRAVSRRAGLRQVRLRLTRRGRAVAQRRSRTLRATLTVRFRGAGADDEAVRRSVKFRR